VNNGHFKQYSRTFAVLSQAAGMVPCREMNKTIFVKGKN